MLHDRALAFDLDEGHPYAYVSHGCEGHVRFPAYLPTNQYHSGHATLADDCVFISNLDDGVDKYTYPDFKRVIVFPFDVGLNYPIRTGSAKSGSWMVCGGVGGYGRIFDSNTGKLLQELDHSDGEVSYMHFFQVVTILTTFQILCLTSDGKCRRWPYVSSIFLPAGFHVLSSPQTLDHDEGCLVVTGDCGPTGATICVWREKKTSKATPALNFVQSDLPSPTPLSRVMELCAAHSLWKALVAIILITNGIVFVAVAGRLLSETKTVAVPDSSQVMIPSRLLTRRVSSEPLPLRRFLLY